MNKPPIQLFTYAAIVSLGGFVFGFDASVISGVVGFVSGEFGLSAFQQGWVVSAPTLGAAIAALAAGPISDQIGRKKVLQIIAFLYVVSAIASALAPNYQMLVFARFLGGLAFASLMIAPMYIAEIAPAEYRGKMVSMNQLNIMIGFSAAYFGNYLFLQASESSVGWITALGINTYTWRWMLGIETLPAGIYFLTLFTIPESPRWLVLQSNLEEARKVLGKYSEPDAVTAKIQAIRETAHQHVEPFLFRLKELFSPALRFALLIGLIVGIAQQITGINAVYFYAPSIFEQSGVGKDAAFAQAIVVGLINVIFTLIAIALIDRLGRKPLLLGGLTGVFLSMMLSAYGFHQATYTLTETAVVSLEETVDREKLNPMVGIVYESDVPFKKALQQHLGEDDARTHEAALIQAGVQMNPWLVLLGILGFVASFAVSLGPVMWVMFSEIFPNRLRGIAISFVGVINSAVSFLVQFLFPWEISAIGAAATFFIYGAFAALGLALVAWLFPETKGVPLEKLELILAKGRGGV